MLIKLILKTENDEIDFHIIDYEVSSYNTLIDNNNKQYHENIANKLMHQLGELLTIAKSTSTIYKICPIDISIRHMDYINISNGICSKFLNSEDLYYGIISQMSLQKIAECYAMDRDFSNNLDCMAFQIQSSNDLSDRQLLYMRNYKNIIEAASEFAIKLSNYYKEQKEKIII